MKKVLVILTVLILVATAVFAEDKQTVRILTGVDAKNPSFILKAGLSPSSFDKESDDDNMNTLGWQTIEKSIQKENIVVFFQIAQKGVARNFGQKYSLSIETSEMILGKNEDGTDLAPDTEIHKTTKGVISDITPASSETTNVSVSIDSQTKDSVSLVTEYKGTVKDGAPIAIFTVTWAKDINAPDGIYQASVILKVSPL